MKNKIILTQTVGAIFIIILGSLLHFVFAWSGYNKIVALFSAVNESTWEHLKLAFWPGFIFMLFEVFIYQKKSNLFFAKMIELILMPLIIIVSFYTYVGILGFNLLFLDIGTFVLAVIVARRIGYKILIKEKTTNFSNLISIFIIFILIFFFIYFTYNPPMIGLFKDPRGLFGPVIKEYVSER